MPSNLVSNELLKKIDKLQLFHIEDILKEEIGSLSLGGFRDSLYSAFSKARQIKENTDKFSDDRLLPLSEAFGDLATLLTRIANQSNSEFSVERQKNIKELKSVLFVLNNAWMNVSQFFIEKDLEEIKDRQKNDIITFEGLDELKQSIIDSNSEINAIKSELKADYDKFKLTYDPLVTKAEVLNNIKQFSGLAEELKRESNWWLIGIGVSLIIFFCCLLAMLNCFPIEVDNLILQASNKIFCHQPSGYNKKDPENTTTGLLDSVKNIVSKSNGNDE